MDEKMAAAFAAAKAAMRAEIARREREEKAAAFNARIAKRMKRGK